MSTALLEQLVPDFDRYDQTLNLLGPSGYTVAINIHNLSPEMYQTTYPDAWVQKYTSSTYAILDPVMQFTALSSGVKRWSAIHQIKIPLMSNKVMEEAREHGLCYGLAIVRLGGRSPRSKHLLSVGRSDRELSDEEVNIAIGTFDRILSSIDPKTYLTGRQVRILECYAAGLSRAEVASELRVSEATVKKDSNDLRTALGAKSIAEAVAIGIQRKIIQPFNKAGW